MVQIDLLTADTSQELVARANQRLQDLQAQGCTIQDVQFRYVRFDAPAGGAQGTAVSVMICYDTPPPQG
jgi:hypothetical protein